MRTSVLLGIGAAQALTNRPPEWPRAQRRRST